MTRFTRTLVAMLFGGSLLMAQLPNPLNLPDPLGLSKKPAPTPRQREGRRVERKPGREGHHDNGKHKGQRKHEDGDRREGRERKDHDRH
ncbi:MAG: hypothetical protein HXX12_00720 [Geothrix sp.]|uniref:hypothetical protein n=1 Tax=Geothrix sp. TaxID=1962974 RepID=UPI001809D058|nr:hypothetical protein [Geothrix sp.]NWJ39479.1 hypothetical protein [Geothrix sp.]WIL19298.1 MAG: hypothetical protein QOZ81_001809 [Geothrix sp.]